MKKEYLPIIYALFSAIVWGASFVATKLALDAIPPFTLAFFRFVIAYLFMEILSFIIKDKETIDKKDKFTVFMMGFTGVTLYYAFENYGLQYTSASNGSLIIATIPLFTLIINRFFLKEHLSIRRWSGIIIAFVGIYILLFGFSLSFKLNWRGDMMMFLSAASWIGYTYFTLNLSRKYGMLAITKELAWWGTITLIPFAIYEKFHYGFCLMKFTMPAVISLLFLAIFCSAIAYITWNKALQDGDVKVVNGFIYIIPLFSIILESLMIIHNISSNIIISSILIIGGLFLSGM